MAVPFDIDAFFGPRKAGGGSGGTCLVSPQARASPEGSTDVDLMEYQGKQVFARYGIKASPGGVALIP